MSYKDNLHHLVSNAELTLFKALSNAGLTVGMITQQPIRLVDGEKEFYTTPDYLWIYKRKVVFLDGLQVHIKSRIEERDEKITRLLEAEGFKVLRILYVAPISLKALMESVADIKRFLDA